MYTEPTILPLNADAKLYALHDEQGRIVGTGTREMCELLLTIMKNEVFRIRPVKNDGLQSKDRSDLRPPVVM
jgi:hypothetical protein